MKQEVCVGGFILGSDNKLLIVKRSDDDSFLPGMWELPGGGINDSEIPQDGVKREILEEVGLKVEVTKPLGVHTYVMEENDTKIFRVELTFLCVISGSEEVKLSFEHSEYKWISLQEVASVGFTEYMHNVIVDSMKNI